MWELFSAAGIGFDGPALPGDLSARRVSRQDALGHGRTGPARRTWHAHLLHIESEHVSLRESENVVRVQPGADGTIETYLIGPRNPKRPLRPSVRPHRPDRPGLEARDRALGGLPGRSWKSAREQWSDWLRVRFKVGILQSIRGLVRFHLVRLEPTFELYASPVNFDAESSPFPDQPSRRLCRPSWPRPSARFHTTGMVEDHTGINNERIGEEAFIDQCDLAWREREAMMLHELEQFDEGLFYCLFDTPDRVQHMFWRYREPDHPANRGQKPAAGWRGSSRINTGGGTRSWARRFSSPTTQTLVIVLSDHGFGSFRRGVNLNTLLLDLGLLALRDGARPGQECRDLLLDVDWSRTSAYALGLGGIYLNLEGRESQGTVKAGSAEALKRRSQGD